jgi:uncharacterized protein (TIGR02217 family)
MAFHEIRFDTLISFNSQGGPTYKTFILELPSGQESRIGYWSNGRKKWVVNKELLSRTQVAALEAFYRARKGKLHGFRIRDWNSYLIKPANAEPLPLLTNTTAQLQFVYPDSLNAEVQKVTKPVLAGNVDANINNQFTYSPDIVIYRGTSSTVYSSANYTIDRTTGIVTFSTSQAGQSFWWSGSYDWPVRFDTDEALFHREAQDIHDWSQISLIELKQ